MTSATEIFVSDSDWQVANSAYLDLQFSRVRLLLEMYKSWLRARWTGKPPDLDPLDAMVIREEVVDRCGNGQQWEERDSFFARDPTAQELAARLAEIESDLEARSHSMASAGRPAALDLLCSYFDLNEFERALLLLCAAVEEDASFARVCAYLHDDVSMRYPTPALTLALFCPSAARAQAARQSFLPTSPLRRYGLVTFASGMRTDDRVLQYLRGFNTADERVADLLRPIPAFPAVSHQHTLAAKLEAALRGPDGRKRWHGVNLFGPQGCGRRALARILCDRLSLHLYRLDVARLPAPGQERQSILRLLAREAILAQIAVYVDVGEEDPAGRDAESADDLIERMPVFFIAATRMRLSSSRPILPVSLPRIDGAQRR